MATCPYWMGSRRTTMTPSRRSVRHYTDKGVAAELLYSPAQNMELSYPTGQLQVVYYYKLVHGDSSRSCRS